MLGVARLFRRLGPRGVAAAALSLGISIAATATPPVGLSGVIYTFPAEVPPDYAAPDGAAPAGTLVSDTEGRLYGVASGGGAYGFGAVFRLTRSAPGGPWTEEVLHSFNGVDGGMPFGPILLGPAGEIYGSTSTDGPAVSPFEYGFGGGTIYRLDNLPGWPLTTLHAFPATVNNKSYGDGAAPGAVVFGPGGLLYGITTLGGKSDGTTESGVAFSVSPQGDTVEYSILHRFRVGNPTDGYFPTYGLTPHGSDGFYGTTEYGGAGGSGTVFSLALTGSGQWVEKIIYSFDNTFGHPDIWSPAMYSALAQGKAGVLYGCTRSGGANGSGGVFALSPPAQSGANWTETVPYLFPPQPANPYCTGMTIEPSGQLLASTTDGGIYGEGSIVQLTPPAAGAGPWSATNEVDFSCAGVAGCYGFGGLLRQGGLYLGMNMSYGVGSVIGSGTVFSFKP